MPSWPTATNWPTGVNWPTGISWPTGVNWPGGGLPPFDGNFASLFPGAYQVVQSDLGITYGGVMRPDAGNTSTTVVTLGGSLATATIPILVKATNSLGVGTGGTFNIYYDDLGITPAMVGLTPTGGAFIPLTGAGTGLNLTWTANTSVLNDTWKATCSAWADQSGNAKHYTDPGFGYQPVTVRVGPNGVICLSSLGGGSLQQALGVTLNLPAPGTTPYYVCAVFRIDSATTTGNGAIIGNIDLVNASNDFRFVSPSSAATANITTVTLPGIALDTWYILEIKRSNNAADTFKVGALQTTGNAGNATTTKAVVFRSPGQSTGAASSFALLAYTPNEPNWAAVRAAVTAKYGPSVAV